MKSPEIPLRSGQKQAEKSIIENEVGTKPAADDLWQAIRTILSLQNQAPPLVPVDRDRDLPLSFNQERLWLLEQLKPDNSAYNIPLALRLRGQLDLTALERSFREILRRHQALRTQFSTVDHRPVQLVVAEDNWSLTVEQLPAAPIPSERETAIASRIQEFARRPFDLTADYLLRACLLRLEPTENLLLIAVHHIAFDGWSEGVLWRELAELYASYSEGRASSLPELAIQYPDFAVWQRQWLQRDLSAALNSYWRKQLGTGLPEIALPTDYPQPELPTRHSSTYRSLLSVALTEELKQLSYRSRATLFATLLASFKVLLHVYTEQEDLYVCSPVASRNRAELKQAIGYFVNLLILRSDLSGNPSFRKLLARVSKTVTGAYAHQALPLQQLMEELETGQKSVSQVMFVLQNSDRTTPTLSDLRVEELEIDNGTADFDLSLSVTEQDNTLVGTWKYNTDLFAPQTIATMACHWQDILEAIASDPERPLKELLVLTDAEQSKLRRDRQNYRRNSTEGISRTQKSANYIPPRTPRERKLVEIWEQTLGVKPIGIEDNFFELGGESLVALKLFTRIEKVLGHNLPLTTLLAAPTVAKLTGVLEQTTERIPETHSSLVPIQPHGSQPPLFLVHGAGMHVLIFKDLATHLGSDRPLYGLQPKGLNSQQTPLFAVEDMAEHYIQALQTVQPQGPYYLGGFSFGGLVAFEMAQQLVRQGHEVALVALLDTFSPYCFQQVSLPDKRLRHLKNTQQLGLKYACKLVGKHIQRSWQRRLNRLTIQYCVRRGKPLPYKLQEACVGGGIAQAENTYVPQVYPGKLTLFRASEPPQEWNFNARNKPSLDDWYNRDPNYGWRELAGGGLEIFDVPGDHNLMLKEPNIKILAAKLSSCLSEQHPIN